MGNVLDCAGAKPTQKVSVFRGGAGGFPKSPPLPRRPWVNPVPAGGLGILMRCLQAGHWICRPANCASHWRCCLQCGHSNLNSAVVMTVSFFVRVIQGNALSLPKSGGGTSQNSAVTFHEKRRSPSPPPGLLLPTFLS